MRTKDEGKNGSDASVLEDGLTRRYLRLGNMLSSTKSGSIRGGRTDQGGVEEDKVNGYLPASYWLNTPEASNPYVP